MIGQTIAHYTITEKIGKGGMGEVYRATDNKLKRDVALKILPESFAQDPQRMGRFQREAEVLASLNHPNIAGIHGLEREGDTHAIAMELAEGETLAAHISKGAIPLEEALKIALQIAEALEAAHEKGIIHRDLKPANVMVTDDGNVKVLDFGLAKAFAVDQEEVSASNSPTLSMQATQQGVILGTAAYMSPEQAKGRTVDKRADTWAFGCVLYEMLTGRRAFAGEDLSDTLAAVLRSDVDSDALPAATPFLVCRLIRRCLEKEPKRRLRDIGDARIELEDELGHKGALAEQAAPTAPPSAVSTRAAVIGALAVLVLVALVIWRWPTNTPTAPATVIRFSIGVPNGAEVALDEPGGVHLALSRDGNRVAFAAAADGTRHLYVRAIDEIEARRLPSTEGAQQPFFSPQGNWIGFVAGNQLLKIAVAGGTPVPIAEILVRVIGASWGEDDHIVMGVFESGLQRVPASGGDLTPVTTLDSKQGDNWHVFPQILPGGTHVLYTVRGGRSRVEIAPLEGGAPRVVLSGSRAAKYVETGHLVYPEAGGLMAAAFDLSNWETTGSPALVVDGVYTKSTVGVNNAAFSVSSTGALVYQPGALQHRLAWLGIDGSVEVWSDARWGYWYTDVSAVDGRVATTIAVEASIIDIWVLGDGPPIRVTSDGQSLMPLWTRDGERIAFVALASGSNIHWKRPDSEEPAEQLLDRPGVQVPGSWSADGKRLAFFENRPETGQDIWELTIDDGEIREFVVTSFNEAQPDYSPDGRWLAFSSDRSGAREIWVLELPDGTPRQLTIGGGLGPKWSPDGRALVYSDDLRLWQIQVSEDGIPEAESPRPLPEGRYLLGEGDIGPDHHSVAADGRVLVPLIEKPDQQPIIVWNWFSELGRVGRKE